MRFRDINYWLIDRAPWLLGRRAGAAHLNLRGSQVMQEIEGDLSELERALAYFNRAVELYRDWPMLWYNRGCCLMLLDRPHEAVSDLNESLRRQPDHGESYSHRGSSLMGLAWLQATCPDERFRDADAALRNIRRALDLCGDEGDSLFPILAAAHAEAGQFMEAVQVAERGLPAQRGEELRDADERQLSYYRAGSPYREEDIVVWKA